MNTSKFLLLGGAACAGLALLSSCAWYNGRGLQPGEATSADVRRVMGEPKEICALPDGGSNWVYPRGPAGLQTFDVRLDKDGIVRSIENVLDEQGFQRVRVGSSTRDDVLCVFGPPYQDVYFPARRERAWDYRFRDAWGYPSRFNVLFNDAGVVTGTLQIREDRGDSDKGR